MDDRRIRPSPTTEKHVSRPTTAPHSGTPTSKRSNSPEKGKDDRASADGASAQPGYQRFVLNDPVAFRYLEEDPSTTVLERRRELEGYECFIVEQWTTSRTHPTFVITTYTGDPTHSVVVGVLSVPTDESKWSPRLRVYFKALNQYHARRRETPLGVLMVTNLSAFPSSLSVIPVPGGDLRKHRFNFLVNEDLKRLGCSGRVGLTLATPTQSTIAKFHQLYRTSDKNEIYKSVVELVKLCQSALTMFGKLDIDYADGLLCDVTESAINDWWTEVGGEYYNVEPHDGILGPTTVAALLGLLMGARNRLHALNAPVGKDAFDVDAMKRGISAFQKAQRISRSRRLDRKTLDRLHRSSAKAASSESWTVPRVVKSTVAELSGKGGEMVMDAVGKRDRAGIAEIETTDLERFVQLLYGERCKWLWSGKPMKNTKGKAEPENVQFGASGLVFRPDEQGGYTWTGRKSTGDGQPVPPREQYNDLGTPGAQEGDMTDEDEHRGGILRRATGFKKEAKSGLGKFRGAVGLKGQHHKAAQHEPSISPVDDTGSDNRRPTLARSLSSPVSSPSSPLFKSDEALVQGPIYSTRQYENWPGVHETIAEHPENQKGSTAEGMAEHEERKAHRASTVGTDSDGVSDAESGVRPLSITESNYHGVDLDEALPIGPETEQGVGTLLRRTLSLSHVVGLDPEPRLDEHYPRHLSFSLAEDSVLTWNSLVDDPDDDSEAEDLAIQLATHKVKAKEAKSLRHALNDLELRTASWTRSQLSAIRDFLPLAEQNAQKLSEIYDPHLETLQSLQTKTESLLRDEREQLDEGAKELETLAAKLDYEINGLKSRIEDVETGVSDFERAVGRVEDRVTELEKEGEGKGWNCVVQ